MKQMSPDHIILDLLTEDIYTLASIFGAFKIERPNLDEKLRINLARETVRDLWTRGLIEIFSIDADTANEEKLDRKQAFLVLEDDEYWHSESSMKQQYLAFLATKAGSEYYYTNPKFKDFFR